MLYLAGEILIWMLLAFLLGCLIGWWMRGSRSEVQVEDNSGLLAAKASLEEQLSDCRAQNARVRADLEACQAKVAAGAAAGATAGVAAGLMASAPATEEKLPVFLDAPRGVPDDLRLIKGIGNKLNSMLTSIGVFHFRQIAGWSDADIEAVDAKLEVFKGRIVRDKWVEQAGLLAAGKSAEFEAKFGKLGENN